MPENEFEKQVQQKLHDFGIKPSNEVWDYIEPRIQIKRRRRRWLIIPVFLLISIAAGSYLYLQNGKGEQKQANKAIIKNEALPVENNIDKDNVSRNNNTNTIPSTSKENATVALHKQEEKNQNPASKISLQKPVLSTTRASKKIKQNENFLPFIDKAEDRPATTFTKDNSVVTDALVPVQELKQETLQNNITDPASISRGTESNSEKTITDTASEIKSIEPEKSTAVKSTDAGKAVQIAIKTFNKKIQLGFSASYGRTNVWENFAGIGLGNNQIAPDYSLSTGSIGVSYFNTNAAKSVRPKSALAAGIELKKQISKRGSLITGINFTYLKTEMETGIPVSFNDTALSFNNIAPEARVSRFFKTGSGNVYTNHFYLLQIPLFYEYKLGILKNAPLYVNTGISANALLSTNMILYDSYNLAYYNNNRLLNKFLLNIHLGMNVQLLESKKMSMMLGPQMQYGLTNLLKNRNYGQQHMVQYGLKASLFLK